MLGELRRLLKETAVYGLSTVVARLLNFLLLPLYTYALAPAEYGVVALVFAYLAFMNVLYGHGMDFSYMRHAGPEEAGAENSFSTAFWSLAASSAALSLLLHAAAAPLSAAIGLGAERADIVRYAAWILAFDALALVPFASLRLAHRAGTYAGIKVMNILMNLALNFIFLVPLQMGVRGVFLASLITSCATFAMLAPVLVAELRPRFDRALAGRLLAFALPLLPAGLASMCVQVIDRPILKMLEGDAAVGVYQANYRLGILMMMAVNMFDAAWRPFFLQRAAGPAGPEILARVMTYFCAAAGWLFLFIWLFIPHIVALPLAAGRPLIHPDYWAGLAIVPVVTLGYLFNGMYVNLLAPATLSKRSDLVAAATAAGAAVNVAANFALIPRWGMMGAAWATLLAYAAMALALYLAGRRLYPVPYEWGRLARVAASLGACAAAIGWLGWEMRPAQAAARAALLFAYPALLLLSGFFNEEERQALRSRWRRA